MKKNNSLKQEYLVTLIAFTALFVFLNLTGKDSIGDVPAWKALAAALVPGVLEELFFRGLIIGAGMKLMKSEARIPVLAWCSSLAFGLLHLLNIFAGADAVTTVFQVFYAAGIGLLYAAVFMAGHNLIPCILSHAAIDFSALMNASIYDSGGVLSAGSSVIECAVYIIIGTVTGLFGLRLIRKERREEINAKWK